MSAHINDENCAKVETNVNTLIEKHPAYSEVHAEDERSNNAAVDGTMAEKHEKHVEFAPTSVVNMSKDPVPVKAAATTGSPPTDEHCTAGFHGEVNVGFKVESDGDEDFQIVQLVRSRSDDLLEMQRLYMTREIVDNLEESPSAVSEVNTRDFVGIQEPASPGRVYQLEGSSYTESPGIASQEGGTFDDGTEDEDDYYTETDGDVRMAMIEEEYVDRITLLERRNYDLEVVLHRLTSAVERLLSLQEEGYLAEPEVEIDNVNEQEVKPDLVDESEITSDSTAVKETNSAEEKECDKSKPGSTTSDVTDAAETTEDISDGFKSAGKNADALADVLDTTDAPGKVSEATEDTLDGVNTTGKNADALADVLDTTDAPGKATEATDDTLDGVNTTGKNADDLADFLDTFDAPENTAVDTENRVEGDFTTGKETEALNDSTAHAISRNICIELFIEFQKRLAMFAGELKGVLNCSDVAIRHARIFHEWGKSKQLVCEQLLHERKKMMAYIEDREKTMTVVRDQFKEELQEQGKQLQNLVEEMTKYRDLMETSDILLKDKVVEVSQRRAVAESLTEMLLKRRLDEESSIILDLTKQSEISMMKLFIMHQQNCIQDLQIQNREQRAIIEGLLGPDDTEDEEPSDTDPTGTPASAGTSVSAGTPERCPVREALNRGGNRPISLVSDVLYCDRSQYLPGTSTDGDIATIQAYNLGGTAEDVKDGAGAKVVFDPLDVDYVRRQCRQAEETEIQVLEKHAADTGESGPETDYGRTTPESDRDVMVFQDGVKPLNIEPYLKKRAAEERLLSQAASQDAAGDGNDVTTKK